MQSHQHTKRFPTKVSFKLIIENKEVVNQLLYHLKGPFFKQPETLLTINPAKNKLFRISKTILDRINTSLRNLIKVNQWKETSKVIKWYKNVWNKQKHNVFYLTFKDFHPRITKALLTKCLKFAEEKDNISCQKFFTI